MAFIFVVVASVVAWWLRIDAKAEVLVSFVALVLGLCYFAQRQGLDEMRLFKELFVEFNARYNDLNDDLLDIRDGRMEDAAKARKKLIDYFNLCAEECLFFRHGHIHENVWRAWCRGMLFFIESDNIRATWNSEMQQGSYYGLTLDIIRRGAR